MRTLVTGGAGFIGSHFVRSLLSDPTTEAVTVLDALTYAGNPANLAPVADDSRLRFVRGDILDAERVAGLMAEHDAVVHLAAESHVDRSIADGGDFASTNMLGTQVLLEAAVRTGLGTFVHVSTDEVYGSIAVGSWTEDQPLAPNSPYSAAKSGSDLLALAYHRTHGLDVRITAARTTTGPTSTPRRSSRSSSPASSTDAGYRCTETADRSGTGCTSRTTAVRSGWSWRAAARARSTTSAAAPNSPTNSSPSDCWTPAAGTGTASSTSRTARATTPATPSTGPRSTTNWATSPGAPSTRAWPPRWRGTGRTSPGGRRPWTDRPHRPPARSERAELPALSETGEGPGRTEHFRTPRRPVRGDDHASSAKMGPAIEGRRESGA